MRGKVILCVNHLMHNVEIWKHTLVYFSLLHEGFEYYFDATIYKRIQTLTQANNLIVNNPRCPFKKGFC